MGGLLRDIIDESVPGKAGWKTVTKVCPWHCLGIVTYECFSITMMLKCAIPWDQRRSSTKYAITIIQSKEFWSYFQGGLHFLQIHHVWKQNSREPDNIMLWATCTTCFVGFLRWEEITVPPRSSSVWVRSGRLDPFWHRCHNLLGKNWQSVVPSDSTGSIPGN